MSSNRYDDPSWYQQEPEPRDPNRQSPFYNGNQYPHYQQPPSYPLQQPYPPYGAPGQYVQPGSQPPLPGNPEQIEAEDKPGRGGRRFGQVVVVGALLVIAFLGGWFGHQAYMTSFNPNDQSRSYANLVQQAWFTIDQNYVDRKAVNYQQMSYEAIRQMVGTLHDNGHTRFQTPQEVQSENQQLSGSYTGIGIYLHQDTQTKQLIISGTIPNSPAEKAGLKRDDIILAIDGTDVQGQDTTAVSNRIHGKEGTTVTVKVKRPSNGQTLDIKTTRAQIKVQNVVTHYIPETQTAHIQMVQYADGVSDQLKNAVVDAKKQGAKRIILDMRGNPGGYLQEAINTASLFVKNGNVLLEQDSKGNRNPYAVNGNPIDTTTPLVVLVDHNSASAAEIVSGSLKDNHRAYLIGTQTFGTGTVLQQFKLSDGSALLLGTSEWLTPTGQFIRDHGIVPDKTVDLAKNGTLLSPNDENTGKLTLDQIKKSGDAQLLQAIDYLQNK